MTADRLIRINELLRREIGEGLFRIMHESCFDFSAVTVTHVVASRNLRAARVLVSVRGNEKQKKAMLSLLRKHRDEIQSLINYDLVLKYTPRLSFELDSSVEKGDHMLDLLASIEQEQNSDGQQTVADSQPGVEDTDPTQPHG